MGILCLYGTSKSGGPLPFFIGLGDPSLGSQAQALNITPNSRSQIGSACYPPPPAGVRSDLSFTGNRPIQRIRQSTDSIDPSELRRRSLA